VYAPVYLLPALLVHRRALLRRPGPILSKVALGVGRSSLFLSGFISFAFAGLCAGHTLAGRSTGAAAARPPARLLAPLPPLRVPRSSHSLCLRS